jgi:hypothetical protein
MHAQRNVHVFWNASVCWGYLEIRCIGMDFMDVGLLRGNETFLI